jgi:DNA-binding transcriptional regulator YiaG
MPEDELPQPTPGPELAELRRSVGVGQEELARRLGVHRVSLSGWENAAAVDVIRASRYRKALLEIANEAIGETA